MDFEILVQTRKSVRGFKKRPVPRAVIQEIIEVAKRAPSSMNTQPWHVHVVTGEPLERVRQRNMEEMVAGAKPKRDIVSHGEYQGVHRGRQVDIAKKLFGAMGIARDDKPMRQDWARLCLAEDARHRNRCRRCYADSGSSMRRSRWS
jgi:nitroreductase